VSCDALGNPLRVIVTPGQQHDITQAEALLDGYEAGAAVADKGYDSNGLVKQIAEAGAAVVIPPKKNRVEQRDYDRNLYADRNGRTAHGPVERFFNRLKQYRRVATRYEKLGQNYLSVVFLASTLISLL